MTRTAILTIIAAAFLAPAAHAVEPPAQPKNASVHCKAMKTAMGAVEFEKMYTSHGACVSRQDALAATAEANAAKACQAEAAQPEAEFKAAHGDKTFAQLYGDTKAGGNGKGKGKGEAAADAEANAHGKCVSAKASEKTADRQTAALSGARTCKAWAKVPTTEQSALAAADATRGTFALRYGTKANAYGKCVSHQAKVIAAAR